MLPCVAPYTMTSQFDSSLLSTTWASSRRSAKTLPVPWRSVSDLIHKLTQISYDSRTNEVSIRKVAIPVWPIAPHPAQNPSERRNPSLHLSEELPSCSRLRWVHWRAYFDCMSIWALECLEDWAEFRRRFLCWETTLAYRTPNKNSIA
jgi:hypothetical protein